MKNFYDEGLCFECKRCSNCCRHSGYVFLSENDIRELCTALALPQIIVTQNYCKTVAGEGEIRISLKEQMNGDCIFYDHEIKGCSIYKHRPLQCKLYPFWERLVQNEAEWNAEKQICPGLNCGKRYEQAEIEENLAKRRLDPIIK